MAEYIKIQTVFLRDPSTKFKRLLEGQYTLPEFEYLANNEWLFTEKVDGTNIRVMLSPSREEGFQAGDVVIVTPTLAYGGKTEQASIPATLIARLDAIFRPQLARMAEMFPDGACLYGEGYGAKIQKAGSQYRPDQDFALFDVKVGDWWLERHNVEDVARKLGLDIVPIISRGTLPQMVAMTRAGFQSTWGVFPAEGIVARPACELKTRSGARIITKIKHRDF